MPWIYVINDLKGDEKNCKKQIKENLELKKVIKKRGTELYVKWKGYDSSFLKVGLIKKT